MRSPILPLPFDSPPVAPEPFADIEALVVVVVDGGVVEVSLLIEKLLLMCLEDGLAGLAEGGGAAATEEGTMDMGGIGPPGPIGGKYGLCRPAYGEYKGKFEYKLETGGGTNPPRWPYGIMGMGGGGGPVLVPISTPLAALLNIPRGPGGAPNIGGTAFSPFPLISGGAAAE